MNNNSSSRQTTTTTTQMGPGGMITTTVTHSSDAGNGFNSFMNDFGFGDFQNFFTENGVDAGSSTPGDGEVDPDPPPPYNPAYQNQTGQEEETSFSPLLEPKIDSLNQLIYDIPQSVKFAYGGTHSLQSGTLYHFFIRDAVLEHPYFKGTVNKETGYVKLENTNGQIVLEIRKMSLARTNRFTVSHKSHKLCEIHVSSSASVPAIEIKDTFHKKEIHVNSICPGDFTFSRNKYSAPIARAHLKLGSPTFSLVFSEQTNVFDGTLTFPNTNESISKMDQSIIISALTCFMVNQNMQQMNTQTHRSGSSVITSTVMQLDPENGTGNNTDGDECCETIMAWLGAILLLTVICLIVYWIAVSMEKSACRKKKFRYIGIIECTPEIWNS